MASDQAGEFVAECLWPDVRDGGLRALDQRATEAAERASADGRPVRYLGSLLMREGEVVLCMFRGELEDIRQVAAPVRIPYDRILGSRTHPGLWKAHR